MLQLKANKVISWLHSIRGQHLKKNGPMGPRTVVPCLSLQDMAYTSHTIDHEKQSCDFWSPITKKKKNARENFSSNVGDGGLTALVSYD